MSIKLSNYHQQSLDTVMNNNIRYTQRPRLAHEHPTWQDYWRYFKQNLRSLKKRKKPFEQLEQQLRQHIYSSQFEKKQFDFLIEYFIRSFLHYADKDYARAYYPGFPSEQGVQSDSIEGVTRNLPLLATFIRQTETSHYLYQEVQQALKQSFLSATNPHNPNYWGKLGDYQQKVCETADFALALWLSKKQIWQQYTASQQQQILAWLKEINQVKTVDNNWHLFVLLVQFVIKDLTGEDLINLDRYQRIKEFYVGNGWFRDGAKGNFDYYNSWGFHYGLFWLDQINPDFDRTFIQQSAVEFSKNFKYLFSPQGFAFFGRSIPYRFAAPCGLISTMLQQGKADGEVKRIFSCLTQFFMQRGAIKQGNFTQGVFQTDRRLVDPYSGAASSLWSLRSFILLLYGANQIDFWATEEQPLIIEQQDYDILIPEINLRIIGIKNTQEITALFTYNQYPEVAIEKGSLSQQACYYAWLEKLIGRSLRTKNNLLRQGVTCYSSRLNLFQNNRE